MFLASPVTQRRAGKVPRKESLAASVLLFSKVYQENDVLRMTCLIQWQWGEGRGEASVEQTGKSTNETRPNPKGFRPFINELITRHTSLILQPRAAPISNPLEPVFSATFESS